MTDKLKLAFERFNENISIASIQREQVLKQIKTIKEFLEQKFIIVDAFFIGTFARHTILAPLNESDVDVYIVLDNVHFNENNSQEIITSLRKHLLQIYPGNLISQKKETVNLDFNEFKVDLVPAFKNNNDRYYIPTRPQWKWIDTAPQNHTILMQNENKRHNELLVPIVKMIKAWNKNINYPFFPFFIELFTLEIFKDTEIKEVKQALLDFFNKAALKIEQPLIDPVNKDRNEPLNNVKTFEEAINIFKHSADLVKLAIDFENKNLEPEAIAKWQELFGEYFPSCNEL